MPRHKTKLRSRSEADIRAGKTYYGKRRKVTSKARSKATKRVSSYPSKVTGKGKQRGSVIFDAGEKAASKAGKAYDKKNYKKLKNKSPKYYLNKKKKK